MFYIPLPKATAHEQFDRFPAAHPLSGRSFGLAITLALAVLGLSPLRHGGEPRWWALVASAVILSIALIRGSLLQPVALVWGKLLRPVNAAVTWLTMGLLFVLVIVPVGLVRRLLVKDPLGLRRDPAAPSYWKQRGQAGSAAGVSGSMANQF
jgi:hypothetical protein